MTTQKFYGWRKLVTGAIGVSVNVALFLIWLWVQYKVDVLLIQADKTPQIVDWLSRGVLILTLNGPLIGYMAANVVGKWGDARKITAQNGHDKKPTE